MQIMINHLTRMQPGLMCTAGIDLATNNHVRPVLGKPLPVEMLARNGGPFKLGRVVDLGDSTFCGRFPEIEDRLFQPESVRIVREAGDNELYGLCSDIDERSLRELFGRELVYTEAKWGQPGTACIQEYHGLHSLGCYWAVQPELKIIETVRGPKVRLQFSEDGHQFSAAVTDIRMFDDDHVTPNSTRIKRAAETIAIQPELLVSIGLSRPYRRTGDQIPQHWLQINNVFPAPSPNRT